MLRPQDLPIAPEETCRVAHPAFPKGTLCLRIADALGPVYQDRQFAALFPRHGRPVKNYRLPKTEAARQDLAALIGADGQQLLSALDVAAGRPERAQLPAVQVLRQVWAARYVEEGRRMRLGSAAELPPSAEQICSPYDPEARHGNKHDVTWTGYKVQATETCDPACGGPHVITNVETTPATARTTTWW